jgi:mevalonate kinase
MSVFSTGFGAAKAILLGEHAVVYGEPAIAAALSVGVTAEARLAPRSSLQLNQPVSKDARAALQRAFERALRCLDIDKVELQLTSEVPIGMGLGSSGALSVAVANALLGLKSQAASRRKHKVLSIALEMEKEFHGTPSGVDHHTSALGGIVTFKNGIARRLTNPRSFTLVAVLAGQRPNTKETVQRLRERQQLWPQRYRRVFREIGQLAKEGVQAIEQGDLEWLGDLFNMNQGLLSALGLSSPNIEEAVYRLRKLGALGAKLTGAGGDGGAVLGLFENPQDAVRKLRGHEVIVAHFKSDTLKPKKHNAVRA